MADWLKKVVEQVERQYAELLEWKRKAADDFLHRHAAAEYASLADSMGWR